MRRDHRRGERAAVMNDFIGAVSNGRGAPKRALLFRCAAEQPRSVAEDGFATAARRRGNFTGEENVVRDLSDKRAVPMKRDRTGGVDVVFGIRLGDKFIDGAEFPFECLTERERQTDHGLSRKQDEFAKEDVTMFRYPIFEGRREDFLGAGGTLCSDNFEAEWRQ